MLRKHFSHSHLLPCLAAFPLFFLLAGCGLFDRIFDPLEDPPTKTVVLDPHFINLAPGESALLQAKLEGGETQSSFVFVEDSSGTILTLTEPTSSSVRVVAVAPGQANVTAVVDGVEGLATITVAQPGGSAEYP